MLKKKSPRRDDKGAAFVEWLIGRVQISTAFFVKSFLIIYFCGINGARKDWQQGISKNGKLGRK